MGKSIFDVIIEYAVNESVNIILLQDDEYKQIQAKIDSLTDELDRFILPKELRVLIDGLISSYIESGALYGRMTYQQGMRDCTSLLVEIGLIKDGEREAWHGENGGNDKT